MRETANRNARLHIMSLMNEDSAVTPRVRREMIQSLSPAPSSRRAQMSCKSATPSGVNSRWTTATPVMLSAAILQCGLWVYPSAPSVRVSLMIGPCWQSKSSCQGICSPRQADEGRGVRFNVDLSASFTRPMPRSNRGKVSEWFMMCLSLWSRYWRYFAI
ncbi:hypothetical protein D3C79_683910 [compost metagenome]